jgi:hypothetical protein
MWIRFTYTGMRNDARSMFRRKASAAKRRGAPEAVEVARGEAVAGWAGIPAPAPDAPADEASADDAAAGAAAGASPARVGKGRARSERFAAAFTGAAGAKWAVAAGAAGRPGARLL